MKEINYQNILSTNTDLIESDLSLVGREVYLGDRKCDLLFKDNLNRHLFVEVKLEVNDAAIGQILVYRTLHNNSNARFMVVAKVIDHIYQQTLKSVGIEYRIINEKDLINDQFSEISIIKKGNKGFNSIEDIIRALGSISARQNAEKIIQRVKKLNSVHATGIIINISDGIMIQRRDRNSKFLSISTVRDRLLFHFPIDIRDLIYEKYNNMIPELIKASDSKNQIEIYLDSIKQQYSEIIDEIIEEAFVRRF